MSRRRAVVRSPRDVHRRDGAIQAAVCPQGSRSARRAGEVTASPQLAARPGAGRHTPDHALPISRRQLTQSAGRHLASTGRRSWRRVSAPRSTRFHQQLQHRPLLVRRTIVQPQRLKAQEMGTAAQALTSLPVVGVAAGIGGPVTSSWWVGGAATTSVPPTPNRRQRFRAQLFQQAQRQDHHDDHERRGHHDHRLLQRGQTAGQQQHRSRDRRR